MIIRELIKLMIQKDEASIDTSTTEVFILQKEDYFLLYLVSLWFRSLFHNHFLFID